MTTADLLSTLDGVRSRGSGKWSAKCPAHPDRLPSLSIAEGQKGLLLKCWAGCTIQEITSALGLRVSDLFTDALLPRNARPTIQEPRPDRRALAFRFELYALDLRMRAERVLQALSGLESANRTNDELDRLMRIVASAYQDIERAELFEHVADTLRRNIFGERRMQDAA
jgi:hypothetical protein